MRVVLNLTSEDMDYSPNSWFYYLQKIITLGKSFQYLEPQDLIYTLWKLKCLILPLPKIADKVSWETILWNPVEMNYYYLQDGKNLGLSNRCRFQFRLCHLIMVTLNLSKLQFLIWNQNNVKFLLDNAFKMLCTTWHSNLSIILTTTTNYYYYYFTLREMCSQCIINQIKWTREAIRYTILDTEILSEEDQRASHQSIYWSWLEQYLKELSLLCSHLYRAQQWTFKRIWFSTEYSAKPSVAMFYFLQWIAPLFRKCWVHGFCCLPLCFALVFFAILWQRRRLLLLFAFWRKNTFINSF